MLSVSKKEPFVGTLDICWGKNTGYAGNSGLAAVMMATMSKRRNYSPFGDHGRKGTINCREIARIPYAKLSL